MRERSAAALHEALHEVNNAEDENDGQNADHEAGHGARPELVDPVQLLLQEASG